MFDVYILEMRKVCSSYIIIGFFDIYGCGCIVGDYRRVVFYGIDYFMEEKVKDFVNCGNGIMIDEVICLREEIIE